MDYKLIIFDMNGTLTNTPFIDHLPLAPLPGRIEKVKLLQASGITCAIASNQGGVAFGILSEAAAEEEVGGIARQFEINHWRVSYGHPKPKYGYEQYGTPEMLAWRKPAPGMAHSLMAAVGALPSETLIVGDREEDFEMADRAECYFSWAADFFGTQKEQVFHVYELMQQANQAVLPSGALILHLETDGAGELGYFLFGKWISWVGWRTLETAPQNIQTCIKARKPLVTEEGGITAAPARKAAPDIFDSELP